MDISLPYVAETNYYPYNTAFSTYQNSTTPNTSDETVLVCPSTNPIAIGTLASHVCNDNDVQEQGRSLVCMAAPTGVAVNTATSRWTAYESKSPLTVTASCNANEVLTGMRYSYTANNAGNTSPVYSYQENVSAQCSQLSSGTITGIDGSAPTMVSKTPCLATATTAPNPYTTTTSANVAINTCASGLAGVGVTFAHVANQNDTYQESEGMICATLVPAAIVATTATSNLVGTSTTAAATTTSPTNSSSSSSSSTTASSGLSIGAWIGIGLGILILIVAIIYFLFIRKSNDTTTTTTTTTTEPTPFGISYYNNVYNHNNLPYRINQTNKTSTPTRLKQSKRFTF